MCIHVIHVVELACLMLFLVWVVLIRNSKTMKIFLSVNLATQKQLHYFYLQVLHLHQHLHLQ